MITLNDEQQQAVAAMKQITPEKGFTLLGEGGTGKTTCVMEAVKHWMKQGSRVLLTAPTNKAVKQMERSAKAYGLAKGSSDFMTIHKSLGMALLPTSERKHISPVRESLLANYDIMVMDEGSMVSRYALDDYILPGIKQAALPMVVMGDPMQLPPVKETESKALGVYPGQTLTTVERFSSDSAIAKLTRDLRESIRDGTRFRFSSSDYPLEVVKPAFFTKRVVEEFAQGASPDTTRVLAWSNAKVNQINEAIRHKLYGRRRLPYEVGERVVTGNPVMDLTTMQPVMNTDEECIVKHIEMSHLKDYKTWMLVLESIEDGTSAFCHVIHEDSRSDLDEDVAELRKKALHSRKGKDWAAFHALKDALADIRYCYCITVHRSQGSTFENVMVDVDNLLRNPRSEERNRLLYVAFSRASQRLVTSKESFVS